METASSHEDDGLRQDQKRISGFFRLAIGQVAGTLGGEELVAQLDGLDEAPDSPWPVNALRLLESIRPGAAEEAFALAEVIQGETHAAELASASETL
jgi:hypothetical protein